MFRIVAQGDVNVGVKIHRNVVVLGFWDIHRICISGVHVFDTDSESNEDRNSHHILFQYNWHKKDNTKSIYTDHVFSGQDNGKGYKGCDKANGLRSVKEI